MSEPIGDEQYFRRCEAEYWEAVIRDAMVRAGLDPKGTVGNAQLHLMVEEIDRLRAELAEAKEDSERLDWLDVPWVKIHKLMYFNWMHPGTDAHAASPMQPSELYLRQAIDAARKETSDG